MASAQLNSMDRLLASICVQCPVCRQARRHPAGVANRFVRQVEARLCPFCRAYARVYGRQPHETVDKADMP